MWNCQLNSLKMLECFLKILDIGLKIVHLSVCGTLFFVLIGLRGRYTSTIERLSWSCGWVGLLNSLFVGIIYAYYTHLWHCFWNGCVIGFEYSLSFVFDSVSVGNTQHLYIYDITYDWTLGPNSYWLTSCTTHCFNVVVIYTSTWAIRSASRLSRASLISLVHSLMYTQMSYSGTTLIWTLSEKYQLSIYKPLWNPQWL